MQLSGNGASRKTIPTPKPMRGNLNTEENIVIRVNRYFEILYTVGGHAVTRTQLNNMKTYIRCKHHKHSPLKHKTIRTTTAIETSMI